MCLDIGSSSVKTSVLDAETGLFLSSAYSPSEEMPNHRKQIMRILQEYIEYYNSKRPHQGIDQRIPKGYNPQLHGRVLKFPILCGLCNHYTRIAA